MVFSSCRKYAPSCLMPMAGLLVGAVLASGEGRAATQGLVTELSPDLRPVLVLEPPTGEMMLVHHAVRMPDKQAESLALKLGYWIAAPIIRRDRKERRAPLPAPWRTAEADRGFSQALLMQLSHVAANWPWRSLLVSTTALDTNHTLQALAGQDAVVAAVRDELVDLGGKVEYHVTMELTTVRAIGTLRETRAHTIVQYFAPTLLADSALPRSSPTPFVQNGSLDDQASTAATDLSQFLAAIVVRVSVPDSLHPHNPTLGELGAHPTCGECRASDPVVYQQPGRVWVQVGKPPGSILALPVPAARPLQTAAPHGITSGRTQGP